MLSRVRRRIGMVVISYRTVAVDEVSCGRSDN